MELIPGLPEDVAMECLIRVSYKQFPMIQGVCRKWDELLKSAQFYEARKKCRSASHYVCVVQGLPEMKSMVESEKDVSTPPPLFGISMYDTQEKSWDRLAPIPDFPLGMPLFCRCITVGRSLVVLGGWHPATYEALSSVYIYNFFNQTWSRGADMPTVRSFFACGATEGRVFVAGGHDDNKNALSSAEVYSLDDDSWVVLPNMSEERDECGAVVLDGKFFVISGYATSVQGQFSASAEIYDPETRSWSSVRDMWMAGVSPSPFTVSQGQLYAIQRQDLLRYCPTKNLWSVVSTVPEGGRVAPCATAVCDKIFVMGSTASKAQTKALMYKVQSGSGSGSEWQIMENNEAFDGVGHSACAVEL